ncbi:hypothetical protein EVAR_103555_1 [Eumeta japonica]|uniref:Uncharacterized protein n=1 Tax=Eumeta variegata TaxID=151549 RepID=A0A4C1YEB9_EUMVA|nr:hypothetical protein EVAR_103555_1 [Eumeta japonica]
MWRERIKFAPLSDGDGSLYSILTRFHLFALRARVPVVHSPSSDLSSIKYPIPTQEAGNVSGRPVRVRMPVSFCFLFFKNARILRDCAPFLTGISKKCIREIDPRAQHAPPVADFNGRISLWRQPRQLACFVTTNGAQSPRSDVV